MALVYWIHTKEMSDIKTQGYVGVTINLDSRLSKHKAAFNQKGKQANAPLYTLMRSYVSSFDELVIDLVKYCGIDDALQLEGKLRPVINVGWNIQTGGDGTFKQARKEERTKRGYVHYTKNKDYGIRYTTPDGEFDSMSEVMEFYQLAKTTIISRCDRQYKGWSRNKISH